MNIYNYFIQYYNITTIYLTKVLHNYECDCYFKETQFDNFYIESISDIQTENDINFEYRIYKNYYRMSFRHVYI